jgi:hypothetical protein
MARVNLYEDDVMTATIDTDVEWIDDEFLTDVPDDLVAEYRAAGERWRAVQQRLREIIDNRYAR